MNRITTMLLATSMAAPLPAMAQSASDVVVMRRAIVKGAFDGHVWDQGAWMTQAACSETAPATRTVRCIDETTREVRTDAECRGTKPATTGTAPNYGACQYRWDLGTYAWAASCSDNTSATRTNACTRYGAGSAEIAVDGSLCPKPAPATRDPADPAATAGNYSGCSFRWRTVTGTCSASTPVRNLSYVCERSGGTSAAKDVPDAQCSGAGAKPTANTTPDASCGPPNLIKDPGLENTSLAYGSGGWSAPEANFGAIGRTGRGGVLQGSTGPGALMAGLVNNKVVTVTFWAKCQTAGCGGGEVRVSNSPTYFTPTANWTQYTITSTPTNVGFFGNGLTFSGSYTVIYIDDVTATQAP